jgi:FO synthase subunit 1
MRIVTYSRNVFVPVTDLCSNRCGYCSFRRDPSKAKIIARSEAMKLISRGSEAGCTEALFSMGDSPWDVNGFEGLMERAGIEGRGHSGIVDYLIELCEIAIEWGLLPHTNAGILPHEDLKRLAECNASMGLMLETAADLAAHSQSPSKAASRRLDYIALTGSLRIPFTTGILVGIGETRDDRIAALKAIADLHKMHRHIQEVIVQPLDPKAGTQLADYPGPSKLAMIDAVSLARRILPESVGIQVPPNIVDANDLKDLIDAGANDLGGISPVTPDWINPGCPWPSPGNLRLEGYSLRERLPIYPRYVIDGWYGKETERLVQALAGPDGLAASRRISEDE